MSEPLLTRLRHAVWRAIDDWTPLNGVLQRTWRFDDAGPLETMPTPSVGDLPALAIYPSGATRSEWMLSQSQQLAYELDVTLWTAHGSLLAGERLWEEIARALFAAGSRATDSAGQALAKVELGKLTAEPLALGKGGPRGTCWRWSITIPIVWNPATW